MMMRVARHGGARHGTELVRVVGVVVRVHGGQVGAAFHPSEVGA